MSASGAPADRGDPGMAQAVGGPDPEKVVARVLTLLAPPNPLSELEQTLLAEEERERTGEVPRGQTFTP